MLWLSSIDCISVTQSMYVNMQIRCVMWSWNFWSDIFKTTVLLEQEWYKWNFLLEAPNKFGQCCKLFSSYLDGLQKLLLFSFDFFCFQLSLPCVPFLSFLENEMKTKENHTKWPGGHRNLVNIKLLQKWITVVIQRRIYSDIQGVFLRHFHKNVGNPRGMVFNRGEIYTSNVFCPKWNISPIKSGQEVMKEWHKAF